MVSLEELCASACDNHTKMADAMLVACVQTALYTSHPLELSSSDIDRYYSIIARDPYLIGT